MTIRQIAALAGVSPATVSFVLNNRPGVSAEKRQAIEALLLEHGYTLKNTPQEKPGRQLRFVRFRSAYPNDEFSADMFEAVERSVDPARFRLVLTNIDASNYRLALENMDFSEIAGVIFLASELTPDCLRHTMDLPVPAVYLDIEGGRGVNTVNADNREGTYLAARHLHSLGHREVGYLRCRPALGCLEQRFDEFRRAVSGLGMTLIPRHVFELDLLAADIEEQLYRLLTRAETLPTAFFADDDVLASAGLHALQRRGLRVPEDVSVVGFNDTRLASFVSPPLTTINIHAAEMGRLAVERLCALIADETRPPVRCDVSVELVRRGSTGFPPERP